MSVKKKSAATKAPRTGEGASRTAATRSRTAAAHSAPTASRPAASSPGRAKDQEIYSLSERETFEFGERLGRTLTGGETILLMGELGTGKTILTRGIAAALGIDPREVGSPTFILVDRHLGGRLTLYHADLYRLDRDEQVLDLGLDEFAALGAVVVVEWGDKMPAELRAGTIAIALSDLGDDSRKISVR